MRFRLPLALLALLVPGTLPAADYYWNTGSGTWSAVANWSNNPYAGGTTGTAPTITDTATFNQSTVNGFQTIALDGDQGALGLTFVNTGSTLLQSDSATPRTLSLGANGINIISGSG